MLEDEAEVGAVSEDQKMNREVGLGVAAVSAISTYTSCNRLIVLFLLTASHKEVNA